MKPRPPPGVLTRCSRCGSVFWLPPGWPAIATCEDHP